MKTILVLLLLCSVSVAEEAVKPPAPPPDWDKTTPKDRPKPTKETSKATPEEPTAVTFEEGSVGVFKLFAGWVTVIQVVDANNVLVGYGVDAEKFVWLKNFSTKNLADDERINLRKTIFKYAGTKTYKTAAGSSKTVHVLEVQQ